MIKLILKLETKVYKEGKVIVYIHFLAVHYHDLTIILCKLAIVFGCYRGGMGAKIDAALRAVDGGVQVRHFITDLKYVHFDLYLDTCTRQSLLHPALNMRL